MRTIFNLDGPVWIFLGKVTDVLILSLLFIITSLPIITIGAGFTSLYYNMSKMAEDTEGNVIKNYFVIFGREFFQSTIVWVICLVVGLFLAGDLYICYKSSFPLAKMLEMFFVVLACLYLAVLTFVFPLLARCKVGTGKLFGMAFVMSIKELPKTVLMLLTAAALIAAGLFISAPLLVLVPGGVVMLQSYIFNVIFKKYNLVAE